MSPNMLSAAGYGGLDQAFLKNMIQFRTPPPASPVPPRALFSIRFGFPLTATAIASIFFV